MNTYGAKAFQGELGQVPAVLRADLDRVRQQNIPVDIVFKQGAEVLGL